MNVKSKLDETESVKQPKKKYYWLGFANATMSGADTRRGYMGASLWDLHMFDIILEKLGIKKKVRQRSEGDE